MPSSLALSGNGVGDESKQSQVFVDVRDITAQLVGVTTGKFALNEKTVTVAQTRSLGLFLDASFFSQIYILRPNESCHLTLYDIFKCQTIFVTTTTTMVRVSIISYIN